MNETTGNSKHPSRTEQLKRLWLDQKHTLDIFLERGAVSKAQYDKSLGDLTRKMGMEALSEGITHDQESED